MSEIVMRSVFLDRELDARLKQIAAERNTTVSDLIRQALHSYFTSHLKDWEKYPAGKT